jgi:hypothetical protein
MKALLITALMAVSGIAHAEMVVKDFTNSERAEFQALVSKIKQTCTQLPGGYMSGDKINGFGSEYTYKCGDKWVSVLDFVAGYYDGRTMKAIRTMPMAEHDQKIADSDRRYQEDQRKREQTAQETLNNMLK